jgi:hypothetical protein
MQTDGSSILYRMLQKGKRTHYVITPSTNTATYPFTASGTTSGAWVAKQVTGNGFAAPATAVELEGSIFWNNFNAFVLLAPNANFSTTSAANPFGPVGMAGWTHRKSSNLRLCASGCTGTSPITLTDLRVPFLSLRPMFRKARAGARHWQTLDVCD